MKKILEAMEIAGGNLTVESRGVEEAKLFPSPIPADSRVRTEGWRRQQDPHSLDPEHSARLKLRRGEEQDAVADAYRILRTQLLQNMRLNGWRSVAVVSADVGEGKTLSAVNLCLSISRDLQHTVLLVDFNLQQPSVADCLGIAEEPGMESFFNGDRVLAEIMRPIENQRFAVLPTCHPVPGSSELLGGPAVADLVQELTNRYEDRIVMFDLPPMLAGDDVISFLPAVDCVLLVVSEGVTREDRLLRVRSLLGDRPLAGIVVNKASRAEVMRFGHVP